MAEVAAGEGLGGLGFFHGVEDVVRVEDALGGGKQLEQVFAVELAEVERTEQAVAMAAAGGAAQGMDQAIKLACQREQPVDVFFAAQIEQGLEVEVAFAGRSPDG